MRHLLDTTDLSVGEIDELIELARDIQQNRAFYAHVLNGKILATMFFEPSTRTRLSFEAAALELGGQVIGVSSGSASSMSKGESIADTVRMVNCYADMLAMRHPAEGSAAIAIEHAKIPVINAGDGGHHHPTQTLADLMTIKRRLGRLSGMTIGVCGDLLYGRTVHSLLNALMRYPENRYVLISPEFLSLPEYLNNRLKASGAQAVRAHTLSEALPEIDVLYMTRVQSERFSDKKTYSDLSDDFILDAKKLERAKPELAILHPLPRVNEISAEVDDDPRACYFQQAMNGKLMRKALLIKLFKALDERDTDRGRIEFAPSVRCDNEKCVVNTERDVKSSFRESGARRHCAYCERELS